MILRIKPLSVNEAWQGRRVKTKKYRDFEKAVLLMLRPMDVPVVTGTTRLNRSKIACKRSITLMITELSGR